MNGLTTIPSAFPVGVTIDRLASFLQKKGWNVFARIDHAALAGKQNLQLRPTELILFGNPQVGTALMQDKQTSGIDLPMKALAWQDDAGKVWLTYNDMHWLSDRHGLSGQSRSAINAIEEMVALGCEAAAKE